VPDALSSNMQILVGISLDVNVYVFNDSLLLFLLRQPRHRHLLGIGALSLTGISLPLVSLTETSRGGGVLFLEVMR